MHGPIHHRLLAEIPDDDPQTLVLLRKACWLSANEGRDVMPGGQRLPRHFAARAARGAKYDNAQCVDLSAGQSLETPSF
jgi:hypothetical protein